MGILNLFVVEPKTERAFKYIDGDLRLCRAEAPLDGAEGRVPWDTISSLRDE